jgi:hypothetical protein
LELVAQLVFKTGSTVPEEQLAQDIQAMLAATELPMPMVVVAEAVQLRSS